MDEIFQKALDKMIEDLNLKIEELNKNPLFGEIKQKKILINQFSQNYGGDIIFNDVEMTEIPKSTLSIHPGFFAGKTLAKAVKEYLEMRTKKNPPTYDEIENALKQGDFDFTKVADVRLALVKNNATFKLLGGDHFGLQEWYGGKKGKKVKNGDKETEEKEEDENENNSQEPLSEETIPLKEPEKLKELIKKI